MQEDWDEREFWEVNMNWMILRVIKVNIDQLKKKTWPISKINPHYFQVAVLI